MFVINSYMPQGSIYIPNIMSLALDIFSWFSKNGKKFIWKRTRWNSKLLHHIQLLMYLKQTVMKNPRGMKNSLLSIVSFDPCTIPNKILGWTIDPATVCPEGEIIQNDNLWISNYKFLINLQTPFIFIVWKDLKSL